jgi:hypothetical protein
MRDSLFDHPYFLWYCYVMNLLTRRPWQPIRSRFDFELAEPALQARMTEEQTNILHNLLHRASSGN